MPMLIFLQQYREVILTLLKKLFKKNFFYIHRHFLPLGQADLAASAALQRIRGGEPQLHTLRLASAPGFNNLTANDNDMISYQLS